MLAPNIDLSGARVLITGAAGFIGGALARRLLSEYPSIRVAGIDCVTDYYDTSLKDERLRALEAFGDRFTFVKASIADREAVDALFASFRPDVVVNLAAQAGVRYSITNPDAYMESNVMGFYNILEACRHSYDGSADGVKHLVYASSSSVYGANSKVPYSTDDKVDSPVSLYAATKKSNELMAHAYSKLYEIPATGLRFFTVYGPCGRPDMAYYGFTDKLVRGETISIFNYGNCKRDFTYIDDIVEGVMRVMQSAPERKCGADGLPVPPCRLYNIGNNSPENLLDFVTILQEELVSAGVLPADYDFEAHKRLVPMQPGDVPVTYADTTPLERDFGFRPSTPLREGLRAFARWYSARSSECSPKTERPLSAIVAMGRDRAIGVNGDMPWHIREDLKHFKHITTGHPVIMGRATWLSLPRRPLPGRLNIVLSRDKAFRPEGAEKAASLDEALKLCPPGSEPFIIGGGSIYRQALPLVGKLYLTLVDADYPDADTFFPETDPAEWREVARSGPFTTEEELAYTFVKLIRR